MRRQRLADRGSLALTKGATWHDFFSREFPLIDTLGLTQISPTFACNKLDVELASFDQIINGVRWIEVARSKGPLIFGVNCYYNAFNTIASTGEPQKYVWPSLGPVEYARLAVFGYDGGGPFKSGDPQSIGYKIALMRAFQHTGGALDDLIPIGNSPIAICEAGVHYRFMGMTDDTTTEPVGPSNVAANYNVNFQTVGEATLSYLDLLRQLKVERVVHYTVSDPDDSSYRSIFGTFFDDLDISVVPYLPDPSERTYSYSLAWAVRVGLPTTMGPSPSTDDPDRGTYWGKKFILGGSESVP